jgi:hypothetical protein
MAEPLKATFFALKPRDRAVLLPATVIYAVMVVAIIAAFTALNWGALQTLFTSLRDVTAQSAASGAPQLSDEQGMSLFTGMFGMFGWMLLLLFPFYFATAAYEAACLRWMIRGEAPGLFGLTFDHDMWRVYGVYWVWFIAQMVVNFASSILVMPLMFMFMGEFMTQGMPEPDSPEWWSLQMKMQSLSLLQYIPLTFLAIRFGPAAATCVVRKQFSFFEAWNVTRDRFFALFGSYVLLWIGLAIAYAVLFAALYLPVYGGFFAEMATAWPNVPADAGQRYFDLVFQPRNLMIVGVGYLCSTVLLLGYVVLSYGINARAVLAALDEGKIQAPAAA